MRTFNGHIYLIDFGTARHLKPGQPKDTIALGSPGYAAPEQYGKAQTTQQSDIYSLGATLHHLLTGDDPAENPFHLAPLCTLDATHPADLETLIADMLSLDASERPASIATVKQELERIKEDQLKRHLEASYPALSPSQGQVAAMANQVVRPTPGFGVSRRTVINAVAGVVAVLIAVASCSFSVTLTRFPHRDGPVTIIPPAHAPLSKQVLHSPLIGSASSLILDPAHASDLQSRQVVEMLLTGLVSLDDQLRVSPQLASSYDLSADGRTITFHLRPNLKFQDGNTLTSRDVAFSLDRALQPATHSATCMTYLGLIQDADKLHSGQISTLINDSILLPDDQTLVLKLRQSAPYFLTALAYPCSYVLEERLLLQYANTGLAKVLKAGGGAGPFTLSSYTDNELNLAVNANYYGPKPQLQEVVFSFYRDTEATYQAYGAGMIDTTALPAEMLNSSNLYNWRRVPELTTYYYAMNYLVKPFDNIHIRQALDLAIDKELLVQAVWHKAFLPTCNIVPLGMPGHNPSLTCPDGQNTANGNPAQAKNSLAQGLQEEGYSSMSQLPPITFTYVNDSPSFNKEVAVVRQMWKNVLGIDVKAKPVSASRLREEIVASAGNVHGLQLWATSWNADYPDPHDLLTLQFDKNSPYNDVNYGQNSSSDAAQQQALQQQLEVADTNSDPVLRQQAFMNAEQQLVNDVAWMPMHQEVSNILLATYVVGMPYNLGFVIPPNDWGNIFITAH